MTVTSYLKSPLWGTVSICWDIGQAGQGRELSQILRGIIEAPGELRSAEEDECVWDGWWWSDRGNMGAQWCMICVTLHYQHTLPHSGLDKQLTNDNKSVKWCYRFPKLFPIARNDWQLAFRMFKTGQVQDNGQVNQIFFTTSVHAICNV